jgi:hypothetical protein
MKITFLNVLILSLASFRLTRLLVFDKIFEFFRSPFFDEVSETNEDGDMEIYYLPKKTGVKKFIGELLSCYWCAGIWAAALIVGLSYLYPAISTPLILILAIAGLSSFIEIIVQYFLEK